jgi:outer membrane murein-binding lipoprotein Lpp
VVLDFETGNSSYGCEIYGLSGNICNAKDNDTSSQMGDLEIEVSRLNQGRPTN